MITDAFQKMVDKYKGDIFVSSDFRAPDSWDVIDAMKYAGVSQASYTNDYTKEMNMNLTADYEGKIKRIGNQFLLKLGCQEFICQTLSDVGKKITAVLTEEYKKRDTPDEDE